SVTTADSQGSVKFIIRVKRTIHTGNGDTVDCLTSEQHCVVGAGDLSDLTKSAGTQITFDPNAPPPTPPSLKLAPNIDLIDRQPAYVIGSGFVPREGVSIVQCPADEVDSCTPTGYPVYTSADDQGDIAVVTYVQRVLSYDSESVDCGETPDTCVMVAQ